ncbi:N-acyl-L-amino acid amidohydrolase [Sporosarcina sp. P13]|uniref:M20 metallopeptidase family protein n=1 Tax=Sporosarcina sp. P13 TaxID=2048263 RepID=UPI000C16DF1A|nr:amidohydrolase [Sporosarcina sp. P13]PIC63956.1 N-acyl-L-amino acid amidohydrolase [Sporosarcina sp. P13]
MEKKAIPNIVEEVFPKVIEWRRHLHQHPELSFEEYETSKYIEEQLKKFSGIEITRPTKTSVMGRLKGLAGEGKTIAMRADIDALPIHEDTGVEFESQVEGKMHACGHDGHTSILLGTAKILSEMKETLTGEFVFLFQHAEELPPGGAQEMVKAGVLDGVDCILGMHLWSTLPVGEIQVTKGPMTSASDVFDITVKGKSGHASQPENAIDALAIGSQIVSNLQQIVSRVLSPLESGVVSCTRFHSGEAYNVIPDQAIIGGSVRSLSNDVREKIKTSIESISTNIAKAHGATAELDYQYGYDPVFNDIDLSTAVLQHLTDFFTNERVEEVPPVLGGEDFSAFSNIVPGCYIGVGAMQKRDDVFYPHHHPRFEINEQALKIGISYFVSTAIFLTSQY